METVNGETEDGWSSGVLLFEGGIDGGQRSHVEEAKVMRDLGIPGEHASQILLVVRVGSRQIGQIDLQLAEINEVEIGRKAKGKGPPCSRHHLLARVIH